MTLINLHCILLSVFPLSFIALITTIMFKSALISTFAMSLLKEPALFLAMLSLLILELVFFLELELVVVRFLMEVFFEFLVKMFVKFGSLVDVAFLHLVFKLVLLIRNAGMYESAMITFITYSLNEIFAFHLFLH